MSLRASFDPKRRNCLVGKRWALQVIRELALGPQRFTDLHQRVAGISTSVLATRLRELEQSEVTRRRLLPPPAASAVYELTERGSKLSEIVLALDEWAHEHLQPSHESRSGGAGGSGRRKVSAPGSRSIDNDEPFACLAEKLLSEPAVSRTDRPGRASLRVEGKVFATDHDGYLIVRLPRERADAVVAAGLAQHLDPGHDSLLREWVVLAPPRRKSGVRSRARRSTSYARYRI